MVYAARAREYVHTVAYYAAANSGPVKGRDRREEALTRACGTKVQLKQSRAKITETHRIRDYTSSKRFQDVHSCSCKKV